MGGGQAAGRLDGEERHYSAGRGRDAEPAQPAATAAHREAGGAGPGPQVLGYGGQVGGLPQVVARFELRARAEPRRPDTGLPVRGCLPVRAGQLRSLSCLGQAAVQLARGPAVDGKLAARTGGEQPGSGALGDVRGAGGQDTGLDRRAEHGRPDEQIPGAGAQTAEQLAQQVLTSGHGNRLGGRLGQLGRLGPGRPLAGRVLDDHSDAVG